MKKFDPTAYRITIVNKDVDGHRYFVGTVTEFPDLRVYEDSFEEAYQSLTGMIEDFYDQACEAGESFPKPAQDAPDVSGRVTLRIPKWLHERLDSQANEQGVSLNFHIATLVTDASNAIDQKTPKDFGILRVSAGYEKFKPEMLKVLKIVEGAAPDFHIEKVLNISKRMVKLNSYFSKEITEDVTLAEATIPTKKVSYDYGQKQLP